MKMLKMLKMLTLLLLCIFGTAALAATGKTVAYPSGNETVQGILYTPARGKGPFPALVVIQEWWGLVPWVKEQASKLSDQGYVTLAVDLYRGKSTSDPAEARQLSSSLPRERADRDLLAAVQFLKSQKNVDPKRIGAIGWCMGGGFAFDLAAQEPTLKAAVINYGRVSNDPAVLKNINAAVLGIFGGKDQAYPAEMARNFETQMKTMGKKIELVIYPDAGHAFQNPNNKTGYREQDAADAWNRTVAFLESNLKK